MLPPSMLHAPSRRLGPAPSHRRMAVVVVVAVIAAGVEAGEAVVVAVVPMNSVVPRLLTRNVRPSGAG